MTEQPNYYLDITAEVCPLTFVKTKLLIERMKPGELAEVRLRGAEPLGNVPRSLRELGHRIEAMAPEPDQPGDGVHRMLVRKV